MAPKSLSDNQQMGSLLTVKVGDQTVASGDIIGWQASVSAELGDDPEVSFVDSAGFARVHDLTTAIEDGAKWVHISVSIRAGHVVIADCLLSETSKVPVEAFRKGDAIRFQPFFLPEREEEIPDMRGRGLFMRGFHTSEQLTPQNVTLSCICDECTKSFRLITFHSGFKHISYMYCSEQPHTLLAQYDQAITPPISGPADPLLVARFEARIPPCLICGGVFRYYNALRCPTCKASYIDFEKFPEDREIEYYANQVYNSDLQEWAPEK
ncbi:MAG: hypothetical protein ABJA67_09775 [Chthonomonadales bacterium]